MNTQKKKKKIQKKRKSQKEIVPVSPALYHGIFIVKKQCRHTDRAGYNNVCELID